MLQLTLPCANRFGLRRAKGYVHPILDGYVPGLLRTSTYNLFFGFSISSTPPLQRTIASVPWPGRRAAPAPRPRRDNMQTGIHLGSV